MSKLGGDFGEEGGGTRQRRDPKKGRALARALSSQALSTQGSGLVNRREAGTNSPGRRYLRTLEGTAQRRDCFRTMEARISSDTWKLAQVDKRQKNKVRDEVYLGVEKFKGRQSFDSKPMVVGGSCGEGKEEVGEGGRGRARDKQIGDGVQEVHIRREGNLMGHVNEEQRNLA